MKSAHSPAASRRVLIIDRSAECREVLRTLLERRGVHILEAERPAPGLELARRHQPDVVVFDVEDDDGHGEWLRNELGRLAAAGRRAVIVLGGVDRDVPEAGGAHVMAKPYHYAPLIRKIEQLIERSGS